MNKSNKYSDLSEISEMTDKSDADLKEISDRKNSSRFSEKFKDLNENELDLRNSNISDLFEDLKDTLDNSVYNPGYENTENKPSGSSASADLENLFDSEDEAVSQLFDTLNPASPEKQNKSDKSNKQGKPEITKVPPTQSAFEDVWKNQNKLKVKPSGEDDMLSDTKESPTVSGTGKFSKTSEKKNKPEQKKSPAVKSEKFEKPEKKPIKNESVSAADSGVNGYDEEDIYFEEAQKSDASDMDLELLKAIGIGKDEELTTSGKNSVKKKSSAITNESAKGNKTAVKSSAAVPFYRAINKEYTNREQADEIYSSYRKAYLSEFTKLAAGIFLFLILLYMEIAPYINFPMPNVFNIHFYNQPYIWIDLQILVLVAALNYKSLIYGVKSAIGSDINVYSISAFFFIIAFIHTMFTMLLRYNNPDMVLYNSIAVYGMILISLYNLLDMSSEITSFKTVSSKKPKYALSLINPLGTSNFANPNNPFNTSTISTVSNTSKFSKISSQYRSSNQEAELFNDVTPENVTVGGVLKTPFISGFFSRTYKNKTRGGFIKYFIYIALGVALILFILSLGLSKNKDWYVAISSVTALILGAVPLCSFITEVYPVFSAQKKARAAGAAFIGSKSIEEISEASVISVYDRDIFPAEQIKISGIKVYGNNRIDNVLQNLCVIFDKLNMSPADTFRASASFPKGFNKDVRLIDINDNGICFVTNNKKLFLGNPEYISNIGLVPTYDANYDDTFAKSSGSVMFLAAENEILAKIYIKYELTADFFDVIKNIKKMNACLCIRTFDPNINDLLVSKLGNIKKYPVRVLKLKNTDDVYSTPERTDSPVVSKDSLKSLVNAILIANKTKNVIKSNSLIQIIAFAFSLLLAVILGIAGPLTGINSGHLFLIQSFWILPMLVLLGLTP